MIDAQTWLVAVAACVMVAAVWAWGARRVCLREDAAVVRAHASGIAAGRALERAAARGAMVADATTDANGPQCDSLPPTSPDSQFFDQSIDPAPSTPSAEGVAGQPDATARREIPAWLREPGGSERSR